MSLLDEAMAVLIDSYQNRSMPDDFTVEKIIARYEPETEGECPDCGGTGRIRRQKDWRIDPCSFCSGTGKEGEK